MAVISVQAVKNLREKTGLSMIDCKNALETAGGDELVALDILQKRGAQSAEKKAQREIKAGLVDSYIHANNKIGVLLELGCETDFVARNESFKTLAHDLCLQLAASNPQNAAEFLESPFVKNPDQTIKNLIDEHIARLGENIKIGKFARFEI